MMKKNMTSKEYLEYKRELLKNLANDEIDRIRKRAAEPGAAVAQCTWYPREVVFEGSYTEQIITDAENAMKNLYVLPGTGGRLFDVGNPPAWKECRVNNEEYLWVLARMPGIPALTEAYILTGDKKYAEKALGDTLNFIETCPTFPLENLDDRTYLSNAFVAGTTNPWRQLEAGLRMEVSMRMLYCRLLTSDVMTPEAHDALAKSFYEHGAQLSVVSPILWPDGAHNHFLSEMVGLLSVVCLFPEFDMSDEWRAQAIAGVERCAKAQITPCGAQIEGSPHYHNICVSTFLDAVEIAAPAGVIFSGEFMSLLKRAVGYSAWMFSPDGNISSIGDSPCTEDGMAALVEKLHSLKIDDTELSDIVPLMRTKPSGFTDAEYDAITEKADNNPGGVRHYSDVGQIVGRTGFGRNDSWFTMICFTPVFNGHAHMDPMSFELNLKGRPVVIDPSFLTYEECPDRKRFKLADYHSCLTFGGRMPFEYISRWTYGEQKPGRTEKVYEGDGFLGGDAGHLNYEPNEHRRFVLLLGDDTFVVTDVVKNVTGEEVRLYFHMRDTDFERTDEGFSKDGLRVILPKGCEWEAIPSRRSVCEDISLPSTRLVASDKSCSENAVYMTVFTVNDTVKAPTAVLDGEKLVLTISRGGRSEAHKWILNN